MAEEPKCKKCNGERSYCEEHDAHYCKSCDIWLEKDCRSKTCDYCKDRPIKPSEVYP